MDVMKPGARLRSQMRQSLDFTEAMALVCGGFDHLASASPFRRSSVLKWIEGDFEAGFKPILF